MKKEIKKSLNNKKGITLIALVITIIVLLILAGVSIATLTGDNGILTQAQNAKTQNELSTEIEKIKLVLGNVYIEKAENENQIDRIMIEEELRDTFGENVSVSMKKEDNSYDVLIEDKTYNIKDSEVILLEAGIRDKEIVVNNSNEEIIFKNVITLEDVEAEYPGYTNFEVVGISSEQDGEYKDSEYVEGKTGKLEVIGNIEDATFKYTLDKVMLGDEVFYIKAKVDNEEIIQKLVVAQGEVVEYDESILTFTNSTAATDDSDIGKWFDIEESLWSYGHAKKIESNAKCGTPSTAANIDFEFYGSKCELLWGQLDKAAGTVVFNMTDEENNKLCSLMEALDLESKGKTSEVFAEEYTNNAKYHVTILIAYLYSLDVDNTGLSTLVVDGIRIWK